MKTNTKLPKYLSDIQTKVEKEGSGKNDLLSMPESPSTNTLLQVLGSGGGLDNLTQTSGSNTSLKVSSHGNARQITHETDTTKTVIEIPDINKVFGSGKTAKSNKTAKKVFNLVMLKISEQVYRDGKLTGNAVLFPLQDLVDYGLYSSPRTARRGFIEGMEALTSLKAKGEMSTKKGNVIAKTESMRVLFTGYDIINGQCRILVQNDFDWRLMIQYHMPLPPYCFALPNKSYDLLYYIFYIARQRVKDIEEKGFFIVKNRTIQHRLNLPNEKNTKNPRRDIKDVIETAITEIEDMHNEVYENGELKITPMGYNEDDSIQTYLDKGYLKIEITGGWATSFKEISKAQKKQIGKTKKTTDKK